MSQYTPDSQLVGEIWSELNHATKLVESNDEVTQAMVTAIDICLVQVESRLAELKKRLKNHQST